MVIYITQYNELLNGCTQNLEVNNVICSESFSSRLKKKKINKNIYGIRGG
jgi:hypothetical protein